jgi:NADH dehydrogenase
MRTYRKQVVIIGGGFGGLHAVRALKHLDADITLIDKQNHHLFQPLLYQVAMAGLSPRDIAAPLRGILRDQKNTRVVMGEVTGIDAAKHLVTLCDGTQVAYDYLVVAAGASHSYMGNPQWERDAPGLKSLADALEIRKRVLNAFERAENSTNPAEQAAWLTFVVVGSGPTGVEQAGALGELAHLSLKRNFRNINPENTRILLVDLADRILPPYSADLAEKAAHSLEKLGVTIETGARVVDITGDTITLERNGEREVIATHTVLWAAGVQASPLAKMLADATGVATDRAGRVVVNADLSLPNHPEILALGDIAHYAWDRGKATESWLPAFAPVAMQQGDYAAKVIRARIAGVDAPVFHFKDRGQLATIGRNAAVGKVFGVKVWGYFAWLAWLFIHLMHLVGFDNRLLVFFQWFWNYITFHRGARLIVEKGRPVVEERKQTVASPAPALQKA